MRLRLDSFAGPQRRVADGQELWVQVCPVCGSRGWNVYVNPAKAAWYCHSHGKGGVLEGVLPVGLLPQPVVGFPPVQMPRFIDCTAPAIRFLDRRGVDAKMRAWFNIVEGDEDRVLGRVVVPYFDQEGRCIYWSARGYRRMAQTPKYVGAPVEKPVFIARAPTGGRRYVLVEGPFDAIQIAWHTGMNALAVGGTRCTRRQRQQILDLTASDVYVMLDGDAVKKGIDLARSLRHVAERVSVIGLRPGEDPGNLGVVGLCSRISKHCSLVNPSAQYVQ